MRLLDLFCGAGGAAMGYHRAGFTEIVGVDLNPQPRYPFQFVQGDALEFLANVEPSEYDALHLSPPCQRYTVGRHIHQSGDRHPDLIDPSRELATRTGIPWVMENVRGAPMNNWMLLCGLMFDLKVLRHRLFESSELILAPKHPTHPRGDLTGSHKGFSSGDQGYVCVAGHNFAKKAAEEAMGIDWMIARELAQAIPPAYTQYIGSQLIPMLKR